MAKQEAQQQLRDILVLFQQHVQQTLDPAHSPHLSASQRNHIRRIAQHVFHHLAGPVRKTWLNALDAHLASLPASSPSSDTNVSSSAAPPPFLLTDLATAQSQLTAQHNQLIGTLQHAIDTLRSTNLQLVSEATTNIPTTSTTTPTTATPTPTKRRKTAQQPSRSEPPLLEEEEASRVVEARAEVGNVLDEMTELLKKEQFELTELHTFLASHPLQHDSDAADALVGTGGDGGGAVGGGGEVSRTGSGGAAGASVGAGSVGSSQLSSPSGGHSKQVAAGLAKRLNRSAAM